MAREAKILDGFSLAVKSVVTWGGVRLVRLGFLGVDLDPLGKSTQPTLTPPQVITESSCEWGSVKEDRTSAKSGSRWLAANRGKGD